MSEQPVSRPPARAENVFTHKLGPFPTWVWIAVAAAVVLGWSVYKSRTAKSSPTATAADGSVPASQVPQFVNQTFTTVTPPSTTIAVNETETESERTPPPARHNVRHVKPPSRRGGESGPANEIYIVRPGDSLNTVARKFGISRAALAHANGLGTGAGLRSGQRLRVPGTGEEVALCRRRLPRSRTGSHFSCQLVSCMKLSRRPARRRRQPRSTRRKEHLR